ncbi:hypothetical protein TNCV_4719481 [Trichonephila clavipes]|uniref:Uncharacterized protein n=1 Tax=Trichonephila clavipes TaxID=2585209 RepID=A0A8X6W5V9_TRICX|nr:hypothetical protein TNCV_4719481 [Trichonephila clavipes]
MPKGCKWHPSVFKKSGYLASLSIRRTEVSVSNAAEIMEIVIVPVFMMHQISYSIFEVGEEYIPVMPLKEKKEDIGRTILFRNQAMFRNQRGSVKNGKKMAL